MNFIAQAVLKASQKARRTRAETFRRAFAIDSETKILDLGSEDGSNIAVVLENTKVRPENVFIADIDRATIEGGRTKYGFTPVLLNESGALPFADVFFDIVYCSSVIEHVTVPKEDVWRADIDFENRARAAQEKFAVEIRRVGKQYFVQTPARSFIVESHTWLPFLGYLPRAALIPTMKFANSFWVKKAYPDFYLLSAREMQRLFPDARIFTEKKFGMTKSIMAIKSLRS
jgi:SAM-dependent methyltransferase